VAPPANWTPITVEGTYITPDGVAATGTVTFTNTLYLRDADLNYIILPKPVQATLDGSGHFSVTLMATDDPDIDPPFYYTVTEVMSGLTTTFPLFVPKDTIGGVLNLADVDRNVVIPPEPEITVRTINGMYGDVYIPQDLGMVATSRQILTGTGLTGGGDLTVDRTLSVVADSTVQKTEVAKAGTLVGTRKRLNFVDGGGVTATVADDAGNNRVNITLGWSLSTLANDLEINDMLTIKPSGTARGVRTNTASDLRTEYGPDHLYFIGYSANNFGGTQTYCMGMRSDGGQFFFGDSQWFDAPLGNQRHRINGLANGGVVFNENGADADIRFEGDTDQNLFFSDASTDRVGIGTATPGVKFDVTGEARATANTSSGINSQSTIRFVGRKTTQGAPTSSTWVTGDCIVTPDGIVWLCTSGGTPGSWIAMNGGVVTLTDAATIATDASLGNRFRCTMTASRTLGVPTNPTDGKECIWMLIASGGAWTPTFTTGAAGFSGVTGTSIASGSTGTLTAVFDATGNRWRIQSWVITA